jgi:tRNA threonylcarbamoyladenosine biosynthesis protein TsaE
MDWNMMVEQAIELLDEAAMVAFGERIAAAAQEGAVIFLHGDLGMGKTTLCRGVLHGFGHVGAVKSPTYTLVEPYDTARGRVYHFDLYRLADPEELEYLGIRDYFDAQSLSLIEWPERGAGILPVADLEIEIERAGTGRRLAWQYNTEKGRRLADKLI